MKKCLSLILMLCLLTVGAFADVVYQDDMAPALVGEADVQLVDISERATVEDAAVGALLENALVNLPENYYAIPTDLFYAGVNGEVTLTFVSDAVAVKFTKDGAEWTALDAVCSGGTVTVTLAESGVVLFEKPLGEGEADKPVVDTNVLPETSTNFTPSVSGKLAPEVVAVGEVLGVVFDAEENEVADITASALVVTPLSTRVFNPDVQVYEHLEWAYDAILNAMSVADLAEGLAEGLTVSDLFAVTLYGEAAEALAVEGNMMEITFVEALTHGDKLVVLCSDEFGVWHVEPAENVITYADGGVTLRLPDDGVLAFLVEADIPAEGAVTAP